MDEELYQEFVTESEESITRLNNALLELESNPDDEEAIDDIFRQAHTLKGNFGAMGFENASTVAHAVEDLLDAVRQGEIEVTPERMDLVFDGMDEILDILHDIEEHGESGRDPTDLVTEIRAAAEPDGDADVADGTDAAADETDDANSTGAGSGGTGIEEARETAAAVLAPGDPAVADADTLVHARIALDTGEMKGVDGGLFVNGLPEDLAVVGADPGLDAIEEGAFGDDFVLFVADTPVTELEPVLEDLWKVESVALTDVSGVLDGDVAGSDGAGGDGTAGDDAATEATEAADDPADGGDEPADGSPMSAGDVGAATGTVPDSEVDPESASAAVDAVVEAYTDDGDPEDETGREASSPSDAGTEPTPGTDAGAVDGTVGTGDEAPTDGRDGGADVANGSAASEEGDTASDDGGGSDGSESGDPDGSESDAGDESTPSISEVKSVRVDVDQLDDLHSLVEQLVTSRIKLRQAVEAGGSTAGRDSLDELDKISSNLQDTVMDMRLIPLKKVFDKFPRLVRDLAREEDKRVDFSVAGEDIELDRTILDEISDPLMHVLRNAVDHGIEPPAEREAAGKPRTGSVELRAEREHDTVVITVEDDGGGIDADAVRAKAAEEGIRPREELDDLPDEEIYDYIFHPGFSTNDEITDVSGRGVGMDVVKTTVESLDGSVNVDSTLGEGTTVSIRLPVSVAIIKVLFVQADGREFGVPIKYIDEIAKDTRIQRVDGAEVVVHDDTIFPLIRLREALDLGTDSPDRGMTVRIRPSDRQIALRCDDVSRQEEVVVTPLQGPLNGTEGLSGTAVVGDGNVVPILDVNSLAIPDAGKQARRQWTPPEREGAEAEGAAD
ncbi:chemotaxis protein CheA [Halobellus ruber]|uniref:Chemotaxis protein CheA n=1 Tax=Halobellus ruber TaxID=2761102 RepID=A0A7J9SG98_9EURY|nr:chemotaxis protein CheA [Halobellus ruber]MBB6645985.1 chemotaxis protein CheA [Halobellus ruber]